MHIGLVDNISACRSEGRCALAVLERMGIVPHAAEIVGHKGVDTSKPLVIVQHLGEAFRCTEMVETVLEVAKRYQCMTQF